MKSRITLAVLLAIFTGCATSNEKPQDHKPKADEAQYLASVASQSLGPAGIVRFLKEHCCEGVYVEDIDPSIMWTDEQVAELRKMTGDNSAAAPVVSTQNESECNGKSTVGREARHLLKGIEAKKYPLAGCSLKNQNF